MKKTNKEDERTKKALALFSSQRSMRLLFTTWFSVTNW